MPRREGNPYRQAQIRVRALMGRLDTQAAREIERSLRKYVDDLETNLGRLLRTGRLTNQQARQLIRESRGFFTKAANDLERNIVRAVDDQRMITFEETQRIWEEASLEFARRRGVEDAVLGALRSPPVVMLGVWESMNAPVHWKTLLRTHVANAAEEVQAIVRNGMLEGVGPHELARRLRFYVEGSQPFRELFEEVPTLTGDVRKIDLRRIPQEFRNSARTMRYNAERIAFSELQNARSEAEVQSMMADPLVKAVKWNLSPIRSTSSFRPPDECDVLAINNFYGLGPGVYPIASVPPPPHPFDRCEHEPVTRSIKQMNQPKPLPSQVLSAKQSTIPNAARITPQRARTIRANANRSLRNGRVSGRIARDRPFPEQPLIDFAAQAPSPDTVVKMRQAVALRQQGLSYNEIAQRMNISGPYANKLVKEANRLGITGTVAPPPGPPPALPSKPPSVAKIRRSTLEKMQEAVNLRAQGSTFKEIGERLGISSTRAAKLHKDGVAKGLVPGVPKTPPTTTGTQITARDIEWDSKVSRKWKSEVSNFGETAFKDAPYEQLQVMQRLGKIDEYTRTRGVSSYQFSKRTIKMDAGPKSPHGSATFRHEYGHHIDRMYLEMERGRVSSPFGWSEQGEFSRLVNELRLHLKPNKTALSKMRRIWSSSAARVPFNDRSYLDDFFGSLTWDFGEDRIGFGHIVTYYQQRTSRTFTEMFANMWAMYARRNVHPGWEIIKEATPDIADLFERQMLRVAGVQRAEPVKLAAASRTASRAAGIAEAPRAATLVRAREALRLRREGLTYSQIGQRMGVSNARARGLVLEAEKALGRVAKKPPLTGGRATKVLKATQKKFVNSLSFPEADTLRGYTSYLYTQINTALRRGKASLKQVNVLDGIFKRVPPLERDVIVYRSFNVPETVRRKFQVGKVFENKGYTSTSIREKAAERFISGFSNREIIARIRIPAGKRAILLDSKLSHFAQESEVLLPRATRFRVLSIKKRTSRGVERWTMELEVV